MWFYISFQSGINSTVHCLYNVLNVTKMWTFSPGTLPDVYFHSTQTFLTTHPRFWNMHPLLRLYTFLIQSKALNNTKAVNILNLLKGRCLSSSETRKGAPVRDSSMKKVQVKTMPVYVIYPHMSLYNDTSNCVQICLFYRISFCLCDNCFYFCEIFSILFPRSIQFISLVLKCVLFWQASLTKNDEKDRAGAGTDDGERREFKTCHH